MSSLLERAVETIETLWGILDDIDTAGDIAKVDNEVYRAKVEKLQRSRFNKTKISTDGYILGGIVLELKTALSQPTAQNVEIDRLAECLKKANEQAEHFEREWYLRGDEIEKLSAARVPQSVEVWIDDLEDAAVGYVTGAPEAAKELARTASKNLRTFMAGKALVPVEPTIKMIAAMGESQAIDDDGIFPSLCDLLDFSGSNKTRAVIIAAYQAMLTASKEKDE